MFPWVGLQLKVKASRFLLAVSWAEPRKRKDNPFFLEEIIRDLIDSGAVAYNTTDGRWQATTKVKRIAIPTTRTATLAILSKVGAVWHLAKLSQALPAADK